MPSLIFKDPDNWMCYVLPPILYPDGRIWMKIGGDFCNPAAGPPEGFEGMASLKREEIKNLADAAAWYQSRGSPAQHETLVRMFGLLFPDVQVLSSSRDCCVIPYTPTKRPYLDLVKPGLAVACGCNGFGAKSADAMGAVAAHAVLQTHSEVRFPAADDMALFRGGLRFKPRA